MKKRSLFASVTACAMLLTMPMPVMQETASAAEPFSMTAHEIVDDIVLGWNLGNTFDSYSASGAKDYVTAETMWGNPKTTKEMFAAIAESDINAVRMPVTWYNHTDDEDNIDPEWLDRVAEVAQYILDEDLYCIIDMHHDTGDKGWLRASAEKYEEERVKFIKMWEQISERFRDFGDKLIFEGYNEILNDKNSWNGAKEEDRNAANALNQDFVDTVRKSGGNNAERCLMITAYAARFETVCTQYLVMPEDTAVDKIIVDTHAYVPLDFTMRTSETWDEYSLEYLMNYLKEGFVDKDIPVIIGEFGAVKKENEKERISWAKYYVEHTEELGIPCFWWDSGRSDYGIFDRRGLVWSNPNLLKTMTEAAQGREYIVPVSKLTGDANLDEAFSLSDLVAVQKHLLGLVKFDEDQVHNADVAGSDGKINIFDMIELRQMMQTELSTPKNIITDPSEWYLYMGDAEGTLSVDKADAITVTTDKTGTYDYYMQAIYQDISLKEGHTYVLSCKAYSDEAGLLKLCIQEDDGDYVTFANKTIMTKTKENEFFLEYTAKEDCPKARINFNCGILEGVYHISDISFMEKK